MFIYFYFIFILLEDHIFFFIFEYFCMMRRPFPQVSHVSMHHAGPRTQESDQSFPGPFLRTVLAVSDLKMRLMLPL